MGVELNSVSLNVIGLNFNGSITKRSEPIPDGIEPSGYQFFETSDGETFESSRGSYYVKL